PFVLGTLLLLCALTFYYFAVLKIDYRKTNLLNLGPYPDAVEYFAQARSILKDGWPSIQIGYDKLPSRYPVGYPALMLPWLTILPERDAVLAPFRTNQMIGVLLLLAVFGFYAYLAMPLTGGFATLLLARGMRWRWFFHCAAVPVVFLLAASPIPVLNTMQFHSPFKTGYDFWTPYWSQYWSEKQPLFSLRYIPANAHGLWAEFALHPPRGYRDSNIFEPALTLSL